MTIYTPIISWFASGNVEMVIILAMLIECAQREAEVTR